MNHDNLDPVTTNSDDASVLRVLLHTINGISLVAGGVLELVPVEDDTDEL